MRKERNSQRPEISYETLARAVEEAERSIGEGVYIEARRVLRRLMRLETTKKEKYRIQLLLARSYLDEGKWRKALPILEALTKDALRAKEFKVAACALNYTGRCYDLKGDMAGTLRSYKSSLRICEGRGISGPTLARSMSGLARVNVLRGNHRKALSSYERAGQIYKACAELAQYGHSLLQTAGVRSTLGEIDAAIADLRIALPILSEEGPKPHLVECLLLLGFFLFRKGDYQKGLKHMERAVQESSAAGDLQLANTCLACANSLTQIGAFSEAKQYAGDVLAASRRLKHKHGIASSYLWFARILLLEGDHVAALQYAREAKELFSSTADLGGKTYALLCEVEALTRSYDLKEAQKVLKQALSISRKTPSLYIDSKCAVAQAQLLLTWKRFDQSGASRLGQLYERLKGESRHEFLRVGYHLGALLSLSGKYEQAAQILSELTRVNTAIIKALPEEYRDSYRSHPLTRAINELFIKITAQKVLQHAPVEDVISVLEEFKAPSATKRRMAGEYSGEATAPPELVHKSDSMREVVKEAKQVAPTGIPVLVAGETGVGKELLALHIHHMSGRNGPFVPVNCAAVPPSLLESELFGYTKGAFTGAYVDKEGLFVTANNGTLFLDEIANTPLDMQAKLLRVLEDNAIRPVGSVEPVAVNVRLLYATNRELKDDVARGGFREDLFYRINAVMLRIPPLRQHREDIPLLIKHFLKRTGTGVQIQNEALEALVQYDWPGNVRELRNEISRLVLMDKKAIKKGMLKDEILKPSVQVPQTGALHEMERRMIEEVLKKTGFNKQKAAKLLGISRNALYRKIRRYEIECAES